MLFLPEMLLLAFLAVGAVLFYLYKYYSWVAKYPRGPTPLPIFGNILQLHRQFIFKDLENFGKDYGNIFTVFLPEPVIILNDYEAVKDAYIGRGEDFAGRPTNKMTEIYSYCHNGGVISSNGKNWKEQRRTSLSILRDFGMGKNLMEEKVKVSISEYLHFLDSIKNKDEIDLRWPIQILISNIINETLFGFRYEYDNAQDIIDYVERLNKVIDALSTTSLVFLATQFPWLADLPVIGYHAFHKHKQSMQPLHDYIKKAMARALEDYHPTEEPTCFAQAYKQRMEDNTLLDEENLIACCGDFFLAGQETTSTTLRWAVLHLANNQPVQDRLREEILRVVGSSRLPSMSDRKYLPFTQATVYETQRIANIIAISVMRKTTVDTEILGYKIPADTTVSADIHNILANDTLFEEPEEFRPERFLNYDGQTLNKELVDHCIPFSMGKRQCAGEGLARTELFLTLAATIQHYRILPPQDGQLDMEPIYNNIHLPKKNLLRLIRV